MNKKQELVVIQDLIKKMEDIQIIIHEKLRNYFNGKTVEEIKTILREENDDESLRDLYELSLPVEDYEICQAIKEVAEEKGICSK